MRIGSKKSKTSIFKSKKVKKLQVIGVIFLLSTSFIAGGLTRVNWGTYRDSIHKTLRAPIKIINTLFFMPPKKLIIDVKHKHLTKMIEDRSAAIDIGKLLSARYIPATVGFDNEVKKVKIKLKGDHLDHLLGDKWSFRIKVKGDSTIMGMKVFSVQNPKTRNHTNEWVFHRVLKKVGIIGLRYEFINVIFNGKDLGLYAIEEHFDKRLIENNRRKDGPIIKFSENMFWHYAVKKTKNENITDGHIYINSKIDGYKNRTAVDNEALYNKAITILKLYRDEKVSFSNAFDLNIFAKHYAISHLFGAVHGLRWHNRRFYFNPITEKLEPIGFDGNALQHQFTDAYFKDSFLHKENNNYELVSKITYYLEKYSEEDLISDYSEEISYYESILKSEFSNGSFESEIFKNNKEKIKNNLFPTELLNAYLEYKNDDSLFFNVGNLTGWPIEILGLYEHNKLIESDDNLVIPSRNFYKPIAYTKFSFPFKKNIPSNEFNIENLKLICRVIGTSKTKNIDITQGYFNKIFTTDDLFLTNYTNLNKVDFLKINENNDIIFLNDNITLSNNLIIPSGYKIYIQKNTTIDLLEKSCIVSESPIFSLGSEENPVTITSSDKTGQGLFIKNCNDQSLFTYTNFQNLSNISKNGYELTGAVTLYNSNVEIENCNFLQNQTGDDYLNIINSNFLITKTNFLNVFADAFDSDFSEGEILNSNFINCGNDAIDFSGSRVKAKNIIMDKIGDKAISAGEMTSMSIEDINIKNTAISICSKDLSTIKGSNISISNSQIGITAFQKKAEYGPGTISLNNVNIFDTNISYLIEEKSICTINNKQIDISGIEKVKNILYGVEYGKASK
jgi:hypothetical protein